MEVISSPRHPAADGRRDDVDDRCRCPFNDDDHRAAACEWVDVTRRHYDRDTGRIRGL